MQPGRLKPSSYRDRVVDVAEEMFRMTMLMRDHADSLVNRYNAAAWVLAPPRESLEGLSTT